MDSLVLYHGSLRRFDRFDKEAAEPRFSTCQWVLGHFFTDSPELALAYARGRQGKVYVTEARFEKMKVVPYVSGLSEIERMQLDFSDDDWSGYREDLIAEGYDAVRFETHEGSHEFVFLHDRQLAILERVAAADFRKRLENGELDRAFAPAM